MIMVCVVYGPGMKLAGTIKCNSCGQYNGHSVNCATVQRPKDPATAPRRPGK